MSRNRLMLILAAFAALAVAAGGFFLAVQPQLARAATADAETQSISSANAKTRGEIARLRDQARSLPRLRAELAALRASVPASGATSAFISQLNTTAGAAGVKVSTITVGDAAAYTPPVAESTAPASSPAGATATPSPTASPSAMATPSAPSAPSTKVDSSITAENFSVIPISVSVDGDFAQALAFVKGVQSNPRLFLIDSISSSIAPTGPSDSASSGASPSWTFSGSIYVLSDTAGKAAAEATDKG